jgi:hypothetical protein
MLCGVLRNGEGPYRGGGGGVTHFCRFNNMVSSGRHGDVLVSSLEGAVRTRAIVGDVCARLNRKLLGSMDYVSNR